MSDDIKNILMNLPEGIVLINNKTKEAVLENYQFNKFFNDESE